VPGRRARVGGDADAPVVPDDRIEALGRADLERMIAAAGRLSGLLDSSVIATKAAHEARVLADVDLVGIAVVEGAGSVVMMGTAGGESEWFSRLRLNVDIGVGFAGTILASRLPLFFDTLETDSGIYAYDPRDGAASARVLGPEYASHLKQRISPERLREYIGVPIELNGEALGVLYAGNREGKSASGRSRVILARFAAMIAPALSAARAARDAAVAEIARERERISLSLHDTIGQILFALGASAKRGQLMVRDDPSRLAEEFRFIELEASRAAAHLREILRNLGEPPAGLALENEIRILASMFSKRTGVPADVIVGGAGRAIGPDVFAVLLGVAREGLHNVEKHADASAVVVTLHYAADSITLSVQDDGGGIGAGSATSGVDGIGLASLRRRVERLGGRLLVETREDGGATLRAII
jgi:signal transduction histidine kinase